MTITGHCNGCEKQVILTNDEETNATMIDIVECKHVGSGGHFIVDMFTCPHCGNVQTVQINNKVTEKLFKKCLLSLSKSITMKSEKKKEALKTTFRKTDKRLNEERLSLTLWADGKVFVKHDGSSFVYHAPIDKAVLNACDM